MLPAHIAHNIRKQVLFYLQSTFTFRDKQADKAFLRFLEDPENGLFKGPWVQLRRPFRPAAEGAKIPLDIKVPFHPFRHQWRSWMRLSSKDKNPEHTIVTTGTGSGKTECFLFPVLDHCLRLKKEGQKGIKAIILYPMNALAADQEKRFAKTIWNDPILKNAGIRVGNYTGRYDATGSKESSGTKAMGENHGISNHAVQQESPPDILLTNYRMLDFLLMRPQDQNLWRFNKPGVLRYLVLDELHTYDGAQGSDVACLIRRIKERLEIPKGQLCFVGTSATLDEQSPRKDSSLGKDDGSLDAIETGHDRLARFAGTLFEEEIPPEAVIGEDRLEVEEIVLPDPQELVLPIPSACEPLDFEDAIAYSKRQSENWGGPKYIEPTEETEESKKTALEEWAVKLGLWLKQSKLFRYTLEIFRKAEKEKNDPLSWIDLVSKLTQKELGFNEYPKFDDREKIIASFFALVAHADETRNNFSFPLIPSQVQLWIRELRRLGRIVTDVPAFTWLDEPPPGKRCLPAFHCSECGESGWIALHDPSKDSIIASRGITGIQLHDDPSTIYKAWFGRSDRKSPRIVVISPWPEGTPESKDLVEAEQQTFDETHDYLCSSSLVIRKGDGPCPISNDLQRFRVKVNQDTRRLPEGGTVGDQGCPHCGSKVGIFFIGSQSATLSSVIIDEMFGSALNNDPKLLAFTDSVQDASHRAGFFTARTYHFTYRTALQHVIDEAGEHGLPLNEVGKRLLEYWSQEELGRPGNIREAMAALMPPDLQQYHDYLNYRNNEAASQPPKKLLDEIETRLAWEATSEFGLMKTHGRTMELCGSSCIGWDEELITQTLNKIRERIPGIDPSLTDLDENNIRLWIYGILHRYRERGAINHPYLSPYAQKGFWGKYPYGRTISGRETYPASTRYKPRLIATHAGSSHEWILAPSRGSKSPWHIVWTRRSLNKKLIEESSLLDLIRALLQAGTETGLFKKLHQNGPQELYVISSDIARIYTSNSHFLCSETDRSIIRPKAEAELWENSPSLEYYAKKGVYVESDFSPRQVYYQERYRKGALRRVVANEHTGLLETEEREALENCFKDEKAHADDPNILTCTSTLEMGIDIGDLSSTMLCSIPPSTASYLQRIGRAGRATGTALIVSVINQRPHDLFFYARPIEMLKGRIDPPGCWLDASAVLVRQYLGFCFDSATKEGELKDIPRNGKQFVDDMNNKDGLILSMMSWVLKNEDELQHHFLKRFKDDLRDDTRDRFKEETVTEILIQRIHQAANEFNRMLKDLRNAQERLKKQLDNLDEEEKDAKSEIFHELGVIKGRINSLNRTSSLEILTDHGLLPNYAFPERGVRFYGAIYNKYHSQDEELKPIEVIRPARAALKELAPSNYFYTHSRHFEIQQIAIGNSQESLIERLAVCGNCGHLRLVEDLMKPDSSTSCPQCGYDRDTNSQQDIGQQRQFVEFPKSQALSYMEHYKSLSGDRDDERQREYYKIVSTFDHTIKSAIGAVGNDSLPFGIEYRSSMYMNEINTGFYEEYGDSTVKFGPDQQASETGFLVCKDCGVVVPSYLREDKVVHRRSCKSRRRFEKLQQEGRTGNPYNWEPIYIYRKLRSEAIRLLLPIVDDEDVATLTAAIFLGLRLRFEGNPAHLIISPQILCDAASGLKKFYLVLMDAVPGGTGYLKALFQEKNEQGKEGEGLIDVLRRAQDTLESCTCRKLSDSSEQEDTDGCYRCIRTYHQQYDANLISRERAITLLNKLIIAGEKRVSKKNLSDIKPDTLFESVLEKKFVDSLRDFIEKQQGDWQETIIKGSRGFQFSFPTSGLLWELELQPTLGISDGVMIQSNPDFLLRCDDESVNPIAIFTDGFEYHCYPNNRLSDDIRKRRSILESRKYFVWNITWDDLTSANYDTPMACNSVCTQMLEKFTNASRSQGLKFPSAHKIVRNGFEQLLEFLLYPNVDGWNKCVSFLSFKPLSILSSSKKVASEDLKSVLDQWSIGQGMTSIQHSEEGEWIYNDKASNNLDVISYINVENEIVNNTNETYVIARLGDSEQEISGSDYKERWRRFLSCLNLHQFGKNFDFWTTQEALSNESPSICFNDPFEENEEWNQVKENVTSSIRAIVQTLASSNIPIPAVEYYNDDIDEDAFAEIAWKQLQTPICLLVGDQEHYSSKWQQLGWNVITVHDIQAKGSDWLIDHIKNQL